MDRRTLLKTGGLAALGFGVSGCAARTGQLAQVTPGLQLAPIRASWDRVIRTTVGLRPHRRSGFVLKAEKLDDKLIVHNYGHGGAGLSLSWGTGAMAAEFALEQSARRVAVIGSGAVGLAAARQLQRRGFDVTIYAKSVPPDTTSNMAWGGFTPTSGLVVGRRSPEWEAQFRRAVEIAYKEYQLLVGRGMGVSWIDSYSTLRRLPAAEGSAEAEQEREEEERRRAQDRAAADRPERPEGLMPRHLRTGREILMPGEHPFPTPYATRRSTLRMQPPIYLDAMVRDVHAFGGRIVIRTFDTPADLMSLGEAVIVNCTGLGSRELFGDDELMPIKGQLTFLVPQPEVDYNYGCMSRADGIALGSTHQRGVWTMEPDVEARQRIVDRAITQFADMQAPSAGAQLAQSRKPSRPPTVGSFYGLGS